MIHWPFWRERAGPGRPESPAPATPTREPQAPSRDRLERVCAEFRVFKKEIGRRIHDARRSSEAATLACGRDLKSIVGNVRDLVAQNQKDVEGDVQKTARITAHFADQTRSDMAAQENAVAHVLSLADQIETAVTAIHDLTHSTKLVAVNARIEAARLGEQGRALDVIAQQLRGLSQTIEEATQRVNKAVEAVRTGLPSVAERIGGMHKRTHEFSAAVETQIRVSAERLERSLSGDENHLGKVVELTNSAWSHLQFQDPMAQMLETINRDLETFEREILRFVNGDLNPSAGQSYTADTVTRTADMPPSGDVTLF